MDKKTRKHSICEKIHYIAIILSILLPSLLAGIGGSIGNAISENAGNIGVCVFSAALNEELANLVALSFIA